MGGSVKVKNVPGLDAKNVFLIRSLDGSSDEQRAFIFPRYAVVSICQERVHF